MVSSHTFGVKTMRVPLIVIKSHRIDVQDTVNHGING